MEDPVVKKNIQLLDKTTIKQLDEFKEDKLIIDKSNAVSTRNAIIDLHEGLTKIELSIESLKETFNKPLTPDEAIEAFKAYLNRISKGKERDKIRIILK